MAEEIATDASFVGDVVVDDTSPPENDAEAQAATAEEEAVVEADDGNNNSKTTKGGKGKREKKEQVPIEELYDLSQPIKRIERPSKEAHEAEIAAIDSAMDALRAERRAIQSKIDAALGKGRDKDKSSPLARERDALNKLKNRKGLMIEQKRQIRTRLEIVKSNADRIAGQAKNARSGMKFTNLADIEKEINRLRHKHETSSMSLADEKKLLKELEALQASRRTAEELQAKQGDLNSIKEDRKAISADLAAKDKEIDAIQKQIDAQAKVVKELSDKQGTQRGAVDEMMKKREELRAASDAKFKEKNDLRAQFRERTNDWYQCQRAIKAQRQIQYEEEKKRREQEHAEWLKKKEEEELKRTPYEEEMALCDYLADYLTKAYLSDASEEAEKRAKAEEEKAKSDVVAVKDDPFAGFKPRSKKDEDEEVYFGKGKKGKGGKKKKSGAKKAAAPFSLNLDLFEQFGMLQLSPPTSLEAVSGSVDELKAKKKWYSEQPRGSVPTAREIRDAARKQSNSNGKSGKGSKNSGGKKGGKFDITSGEDFAPLGTE